MDSCRVILDAGRCDGYAAAAIGCEATAEAKAILIAGPDSAKSELAAHLTRHHPEVAGRIVGIETIDHPSDGALVAVARLRFNTKDNSQSQISQTDLGS